MGARFNRQDVVLGALPVGTPVPEDVIDVSVASEGLPNEPFDWDVLPPGATGQVLTVNADGSIGWAAGGGGGGSGTVTSVSWTGDGTIFTASADTPVTTSGTLTPASLIAQTAHYVLAGPTSAGPTAPTFRALASSDMPSSGAGSGTVTSVSWTGDGTIFTASADTPVTTSGTLTPASLIAQTAHYVLAGPTSAGPTAPTFRALAAADLPTTGLAFNSGTSVITVDTPSAGAVTCNLATSNWHQITFAANTTITLSNVGTNQQFTLIIIQGGSGSYTATFSGMTIKWPGGAAPTLTTAVGGIDVLTFKQISAGNYYGFVAGAALA